jgi:hypothetical protein
VILLRVAVAQYAQAIPALAAQGQDPSQIVSQNRRGN